jgi:uncharacterized HAD superfamily protein
MQNKKRIAIDLDDVTFDFIGPFLEFANKKYGTNYSRANVTFYNLEKSGIIPKGTNDENVQDFYEHGLLKSLPLIEDAKPSITLLSEKFDIIYLTGRSIVFADDTEQSLIDNNIWAPVYYASRTKSKGDWMVETKAKLLLDDNPYYINDVRAKSEAKTILFTTIEESIKLANAHEFVRNWKEAYLCIATRYRFNEKGPE